MQKTFILLMLVVFSSLANSQDSTDYTLNNIKRYATGIEQSLAIISSNTETGKQQAVVKQAEYMKAYIDSAEDEMEYLPDEYYYRLSSLVSSYHTAIDEFEKLVLNKDFEGKDTYVARAFNSLQQQQRVFNQALQSAYATAMHLQPGMQIKAASKDAVENGMQDAEPDNTVSNTTAANSNNVVLVEAVEPKEITTSNNFLLLDTIHETQQQINQWINSIRLGLKENNFSKVGVDASGISNASLKIRDLVLLLKTDQKESLFILATGLQNLSETLHQLTLKGIAAQDAMQECIDKIAVKFGTLSTGISLVQ